MAILNSILASGRFTYFYMFHFLILTTFQCKFSTWYWNLRPCGSWTTYAELHAKMRNVNLLIKRNNKSKGTKLSRQWRAAFEFLPERSLFHGLCWQQIAGAMALQSHGDMLLASHRDFHQLMLNGLLSFQIVNCLSLSACQTRTQMLLFKISLLDDVSTLKECKAIFAYSAVSDWRSNELINWLNN
jgi:hypothetical protein